MQLNKNNKTLGFWTFLLCFTVLFTGCQTTNNRRTSTILKTPALAHGQALVSIFIQLADENGSEAWLKTSTVELIGEQGVTPLAGGSHELSGAEIGGGQRLFARGPVPAGNYQSLRIHMDKAALLRGGKKLFLTLNAGTIDLPLQSNFQVQAGESRTLIITWNDQKSISRQSHFKAEMDVRAPHFPLLANLAYVSCPDIDTLYLLSTDSNRISGSIAIKGKPTYMTYSALRKRLYILSEKQASITVVETATNRIVDHFKIPMMNSPSFFMSPDGEQGYLLDEKRGDLIRMDLNRGSMVKRVHLGYKPRFLAFHEAGKRLVLTSGLDQKVYFINPETLKIQDVLLVGSNPDGLLVNDKYLYVTEQGSNTLNIFDINTLRPLKKLTVGFGPRRLIEKNNNVYVANYKGSSISLVLASQQRMARSIPVGNGPFEMALSNQRKWLYVISQHDGAISVLDQTSSKLTTTIELGSKPADILTVY